MFGDLCFEGEYLYDERIKGKAYIKGKLEYEGDFLYLRKYNGKGYDDNGNLLYELNKGNGKVKEYYALTESLIFDGEYLNGNKDRKWKEKNFYYIRSSI